MSQRSFSPLHKINQSINERETKTGVGKVMEIQGTVISLISPLGCLFFQPLLRGLNREGGLFSKYNLNLQYHSNKLMSGLI